MAQIILLSGGLDSLISYKMFASTFYPVFVRTGSRYEQRDLACAHMLAPHLRVIDLPRLVEQYNGVVSHRNAIILSLVANQCDAEEICVSAPLGEMIADQQPSFYRKMERVLNVRVFNPLRHYTKTQLVGMYLATHRDAAERIKMTRSCYSDQLHRCGACSACFKRWVSLKNNGIKERYSADPSEFANLLDALPAVTKMLALARYGVRPTWEAWRAVRDA